VHLASSSIPEILNTKEVWDLVEKIQDNNMGPHHAFIPEFIQKEHLLISSINLFHLNLSVYINNLQYSELRTECALFDQNQATILKQSLLALSKTQYWKDSFYYQNGIDILEGLVCVNSSVLLKEGAFLGVVTSIPITQKQNWEGVQFFAQHSISQNASLSYVILDAATNLSLLQISANDAILGVDLSSLASKSIKLQAVFNRTELNVTSTLNEWKVIGDLDKIVIFSWDSYLVYIPWLMGGVVLIAICVCMKRRKKM
jgi:hypothetical protein